MDIGNTGRLLPTLILRLNTVFGEQTCIVERNTTIWVKIERVVGFAEVSYCLDVCTLSNKSAQLGPQLSLGF